MKCKICGKHPSEISEYIDASKEYMCTEEEYVRAYEGTYNRRSDEFYCTDCYISIGMPLGTA